jgi:alternate signal-mediated exported protein
MAALMAVVALTLALWSAQDTSASITLKSGHLQASAGSFEWEETTPNVPKAALASGSDLESLAAFPATPGDSFVLRQQVEISARGNNLVYQLSVDWDGTPTPTDRIKAVYQVLDAAGQVVAGGANGTEIGTSVQITDLEPGITEYWVKIEAQYPETVQLYQDQPSNGPLPTFPLPQLVINLQQVRGAA